MKECVRMSEVRMKLSSLFVEPGQPIRMQVSLVLRTHSFIIRLIVYTVYHYLFIYLLLCPTQQKNVYELERR